MPCQAEHFPFASLDDFHDQALAARLETVFPFDDLLNHPGDATGDGHDDPSNFLVHYSPVVKAGHELVSSHPTWVSVQVRLGQSHLGVEQRMEGRRSIGQFGKVPFQDFREPIEQAPRRAILKLRV